MRQTNLLVLAGGLGTRLRTVVSEVPKPLAPVLNHPYLFYLLENWKRQGITKITFLLHYQANLIEEFLKSEQTKAVLGECEVSIVREPQPLGTGGAVAYAVQQLGLIGSMLVVNADTWLGSGIEIVSNSPPPAMAIVQVESVERYGNVEVIGDRVDAFEEKGRVSGSGYINAGLYHLHTDSFKSWEGRAFSLERELFPEMVDARQLRAVPLKTEFIDIGIPEDYDRFCRWIECGRVGLL